MRYHIGDKIICRITDTDVFILDQDFDDPRYKDYHVRSIEVIGVADEVYIVLAPKGIETYFSMREDYVGSYGADPKYIGRDITFVKERAVGGRETFDPYLNPLKCLVCQQYYPWAVSNQNNGTFACWSCRTDQRYRLIYNLK